MNSFFKELQQETDTIAYLACIYTNRERNLMILDDKEKDRFVAWLEQTSKTCVGFVEELKKMPGPGMDEFSRREKLKAAACQIIIKELTSGEKVTIK